MGIHYRNLSAMSEEADKTSSGPCVSTEIHKACQDPLTPCAPSPFQHPITTPRKRSAVQFDATPVSLPCSTYEAGTQTNRQLLQISYLMRVLHSAISLFCIKSREHKIASAESQALNIRIHDLVIQHQIDNRLVDPDNLVSKFVSELFFLIGVSVQSVIF